MFARLVGTALVLTLVPPATAAQHKPTTFHPIVGVLQGDPLERLNLKVSDLEAREERYVIRYLGMTTFLNDARATVTTTIDDSTDDVPSCIDALDKYRIKASIAISTQRGPIKELWPRLRQAIDNGHEVAFHSRRHLCQWPDSEIFCRQAYSQDETVGSRNDILANT